MWTQSSAAASRRRSRVILTLGKIEGSSPGTSIARQLSTPNRICCFGRISRSPPDYWSLMPRSSTLFLATLAQIKSGTRPHRCAKSELPRQVHLQGKRAAVRPLWQAKEKSLKVMVSIRLLLPDGDIQVLRSSSPTARAGYPDGWLISDDRRARAPRLRAITNRRSVNANSARSS